MKYKMGGLESSIFKGLKAVLDQMKAKCDIYDWHGWRTD